jgi:NAD(P)-dependent dehydrogenase (short-subunit alcohol dehydrogenase family)
MEDRAVLVVGASAGIGRAIATVLVSRGARVGFCARRVAALGDAIDAAGGGTPLVGDVRDPEDCERIVAECVRAFGRLDAVCYAAAVSPLRMLADTTAEDWRMVFETNVTGAALVTRAALPYLDERSVIAYLSSEGVGRPRHGLVAYTASKMALEEMIRGFRIENPDRRFVKVTVGATSGTEFALEFDPDLAAQLLPEWVSHGEMRSRFMDVDDVATVTVDHLESAFAHPAIDVQELVLRPTGPLMTDPTELLGMFEEITSTTQ